MANLSLGSCFEFEVTIDEQKVVRFAELTGDDNPIHLSKEYAASTRFKYPIVHGMLASSYFSTIFGKHFPGEGSIYLAQEVKFLKPIFVGATVQYKVEISELMAMKGIYVFSTKAFVNKELVIDGSAKVVFRG